MTAPAVARPSGGAPKPALPRMLFVDDEKMILDAIGRTVHGRYEAVKCTVPMQAVQLLQQDASFVCIVADLRMPGMSGVDLLAQAKQLAPDAARILLTGQADMQSAAASVNKGGVFRFLTKPCPPADLLAALEAGTAEHHRLLGERQLLEDTVHGAIDALADVLGATLPAIMGRAARAKRRLTDYAARNSLRERFPIEAAATIVPIGWSMLPPPGPGLAGREDLDPEASAAARRAAELSAKTIAHIPRMEEVATILRWSRAPYVKQTEDPEVLEGEALPLGARLLHIAYDLELLIERGYEVAEAHEIMLQRLGRYDMVLVDDICKAPPPRARNRPLTELQVRDAMAGMVLAADVRRPDGSLLIARGTRITHRFVAWVQEHQYLEDILDLDMKVEGAIS